MKSHERAADAIKDGRLADEIVPVADPAAQGRPAPRRDRRGRAPGHDHGVARQRSRPAFDKDGTITAGNASQISDGGSAVIVMSKAEAERRGVQPLGEVVAYGMVAGPDDVDLLHQPSRRHPRGARPGRR